MTPTDALTSPAPWLAAIVRFTQVQLDNQYATAKTRYIGEVGDWVKENQQNRDMGHPLTQFLFTKPVRQIAYAAEPSDDPAMHAATLGGQVKQYADDVDPSLPEAKLPDPIRVVPTLGGPGQMLAALVAEGAGVRAGDAPPPAASNPVLLQLLQQIVAALQAVGIMPK